MGELLQDELKRLIKTWKKEAEVCLGHTDAKGMAITFEKCAEDLEVLLLWHSKNKCIFCDPDFKPDTGADLITIAKEDR